MSYPCFDLFPYTLTLFFLYCAVEAISIKLALAQYIFLPPCRFAWAARGNAAALSEWRAERREALCRATSWKSSETQTLGEMKRAGEEVRERRREGRIRRLEVRGGGNRTDSMARRKALREFAPSESWSLDVKVMLVLSMRTVSPSSLPVHSEMLTHRGRRALFHWILFNLWSWCVWGFFFFSPP